MWRNGEEMGVKRYIVKKGAPEGSFSIERMF